MQTVILDNKRFVYFISLCQDKSSQSNNVVINDDYLSYLRTALESIQSLLHAILKKKKRNLKVNFKKIVNFTYSNHVIFDALQENPNGIVQVLVRISSSPLPTFGSVHGCRNRSGIACIVSFSTVSQQGFEVLNVLGSAVSAQESHLHTKTTSVSCTLGLTDACIF